MKAVILAAGKGMRMRPLTIEKPKPMVEILGRPLLQHILDSLPKAITEIILVVGYKEQAIMDYFGQEFEGRKIIYIKQEEYLGTAHALGLAQPHLQPGERFLFMFADDLHSASAIDRLVRGGQIGMLAQEHPDPRPFGVLEIDAQNHIVDIEEKPEKPKSNLVSIGVMVLDDRIFNYPLTKGVKDEYHYADQIKKLIKDHPVIVEKTDFWHPISSPHHLDSAEKILIQNHGHIQKENDTLVVILAGGKGTRLPDNEKDKPKCMVEVAGKPILQHQLDLLQKQGFKNIRIALGYMSEYVIDWLKKNHYDWVDYVIEKEPLGTGGGLKFATQDTGKPFLSFFGDILADFNFHAVLRASAGGKYRVLAGVHFDDVSGLGVLECDEDKRVCAFKEKQAEGVPGLINANASYLNPADFKDMPDKFSIEYDLYPKLAAEGKLVLHEHRGNYWFDCGTTARLQSVRDYFSQGHF